MGDERSNDYILQKFKNQLGSTTFHPFKVLELMDMSGSKLNYECFDLLRSLETDNRDTRRMTIIPSSARLKRVAATVERVGDRLVPFKLTAATSSSVGESVEFNPEKVLKVILRASNLNNLPAGETAILSQAIDGSRFSHNINFIMYGIKINDPRASCPWTKLPLFSADGTKSKIQSRNNQIPLKLLIGRETSSIYTEFEQLFRSLPELRTFEVGGESRITALDASSVCTDLSATWKGTGKGGACKVKTYFCSCCATLSADAVKWNPVRCNRWCFERPETFKCYHKTFLTDEVILRQETELQRMVQDTLNYRLQEIDRWKALCQLNQADDPRIPSTGSQNNPLSIHYQIDMANCLDKSNYLVRVTNDLSIRGLSVSGESLRILQSRLKEAMIGEFNYIQLQHDVYHGNAGRAAALWNALNNPPCILHMYMRVTIKILTTVLRAGLSNAMVGHLDEKLFGEETRLKSEKERFERFINKLEILFNTSVFGDDLNPTHWSAPVDKQERNFCHSR